MTDSALMDISAARWRALRAALFAALCVLLSAASHGTDHLIVQRLLATRSLRDARVALVGSGVHGNPTTYPAGGTQYVAFVYGAGGGGIWPLYSADFLKKNTKGGGLMVFAVEM